MPYDQEKLSFKDLLAPTVAATEALARLDERVSRSPLGQGWIDRSHFGDACASLWVDGELVHVEDLVLHDAGMGVRRPTHELTIAQDILRTRRRILAHPKGWALSSEGLRRLRRADDDDAPAPETKSAANMSMEYFDGGGDEDDPFASELAAIDAVLARSEALLATARDTAPRRDGYVRDPLLYEADWDEDERLSQWQDLMGRTEDLPAVLRAAILLDAWDNLQVLQHAHWVGRLLIASLLRDAGVTAAYLLPTSLGLKSVARERRRHRDGNTRVLASLEAMQQAGELGLKEHDRLLLARQQMEHRLVGRRSSSKLPQLIDLVLSKPMVSTRMIADVLSVTPQGALKIAGELNLRELTGRGRFRAWGIL